MSICPLLKGGSTVLLLALNEKDYHRITDLERGIRTNCTQAGINFQKRHCTYNDSVASVLRTNCVTTWVEEYKDTDNVIVVLTTKYDDLPDTKGHNSSPIQWLCEKYYPIKDKVEENIFTYAALDIPSCSLVFGKI